MANPNIDINKAYEIVLEYMDLLGDYEVDQLELRSSQVLFERYNQKHPDDFVD